MKFFCAVVFIFVASICVPRSEAVACSSLWAAPSFSAATNPSSPQSIFSCKEDTARSFNSCGIDAIPFMRPLLYDIDKDGALELIVGGKDGALRLYKKDSPTPGSPWRLVKNYFQGIAAGAFSAPAAADLDGDGIPEVALGTGGFSSESGRILIYKNTGSPQKPHWQQVSHPPLLVGNDATPAFVDIDGDGRLDIVAGTSTGQVVLFRNVSTKDELLFQRDKEYFGATRLGMYSVPTAVRTQSGVIIMAGESNSALFLFEKPSAAKGRWKKITLPVKIKSFIAPSLVDMGSDGLGLFIADGDGRMHFLRSRSGNPTQWASSPEFSCSRLTVGAASAPIVAARKGKPSMVLGSINGDLRLFEQILSEGKIFWKERTGFFKGIKLTGFARAMLTTWGGKDLLVAGQQAGKLRAFFNYGSSDKPRWRENKKFFSSLPAIAHATPFVFDLDNDGKWELVVGDANGQVRGFKYGKKKVKKRTLSSWIPIDQLFDGIKVERFAAPALFKQDATIYMLVGQQNGSVRSFVLDPSTSRFSERAPLLDAKADGHSSPCCVVNEGHIQLTIGDYNGNLRQFSCELQK